MQLSFDILSIGILMTGLALQFFWLTLGKRGRSKYLQDITQFKSPSGRLSRYYSWRLSSPSNIFVEGIMFIVILLTFLLVPLLYQGGIELVFTEWLYLAVVIFFSALTTVQITLRVRKMITKEQELRETIESKEDKIAWIRQIVDMLYSQGPAGDGRKWFILFRLAQEQNPLGWSVRDVLQEKNRTILAKSTGQVDSIQSQPEEKGLGIE